MLYKFHRDCSSRSWDIVVTRTVWMNGQANVVGGQSESIMSSSTLPRHNNVIKCDHWCNHTGTAPRLIEFIRIKIMTCCKSSLLVLLLFSWICWVRGRRSAIQWRQRSACFSLRMHSAVQPGTVWTVEAHVTSSTTHPEARPRSASASWAYKPWQSNL